MSQTDSFIDEVTEEVRRDRINRLARRYGWIAVLVVVIGVAAAAVVEWRKGQARSEARALGDAIYAALEHSSADARALSLTELEAEGAAAALTAMLAAGEIAPSDPAEALSILQGVAERRDVPALYRETAILKQTMIPGVPLSSDDMLALLEPLTAPGAPLRLLALEQMALVRVERGERDAAAVLLTEVMLAAETSAGQRERAGQILGILGIAPGTDAGPDPAQPPATPAPDARPTTDSGAPAEPGALAEP